MPVDAAAVIETIHGLQVDLSILAAWLAREPEPAMQYGAVVALAAMRECLTCHELYSAAPRARG
jgi:hypothetical protein